MTDIIAYGDFLWVEKVHASTPGKAENFEDEGVEEASKVAIRRQRQAEWEKNYLENLQK